MRLSKFASQLRHSLRADSCFLFPVVLIPFHPALLHDLYLGTLLW